MRWMSVAGLGMMLLWACAGGGGYNYSTYAYQIEDGLRDREKFATFVIASINLGKPSRSFLQEHESKIDQEVTRYLEKHGYEVLPSDVFEKHFEEGVRKFGEPFDASTGRINQRSFVAALQHTMAALQEDGGVDAVIFTDLSETQEFFSAGINHVARFNGVSRKPSMQGPGEGVAADFNWVQEVDAVSLFVNIFDLELQRLFNGAGGIELTEAIDTRGSAARFARRRTVLGNESHIREGIELALHPLIEMSDWPGKKN